MKIKILVNTFLKKFTDNSSELRPEDKLSLAAGTILYVSSNGLVDKGHIKVSLTLGGVLYKDYYLFSRHLEIVKAVNSLSSSRKINKAGLDLIKSFEGLRLVSYADPGTGGKPYTVGYGHTGPEINRAGIKIDMFEADKYLAADLSKFEQSVSNLITVPLTDNEFAALVSFAYNCGPANLSRSSVRLLINHNKKEAGFKCLKQWNRANGKVMAGLTRRRLAEVKLSGHAI